MFCSSVKISRGPLVTRRSHFSRANQIGKTTCGTVPRQLLVQTLQTFLAFHFFSSPTSFMAARETQPRHPINQTPFSFTDKPPFPIYKTNGAQGWYAHGPLHHHLTTAPPNNACIPNEPTNPRSMWTRTTFSSKKKKIPLASAPHRSFEPSFPPLYRGHCGRVSTFVSNPV